MIYPLAYISIILVFRNKVFQTDTFIFWYMGLISGVFISLMFLFFLHLAGFDEVTLTTSSLVNILRCGGNCTGNTVFIVDGKWPLVIICLFNGLRNIAFFLSIKLGNRNHDYKQWTDKLKFSVIQRENDPVANVFKQEISTLPTGGIKTQRILF